MCDVLSVCVMSLPHNPDPLKKQYNNQTVDCGYSTEEDVLYVCVMYSVYVCVIVSCVCVCAGGEGG